VTKAGADFAATKHRSSWAASVAESEHETALVRARRQIVAVRRRMAAVPAPAQAAHLRTLLLQVVDRQAALTKQLAKLVVFLPAFDLALRPLSPATRRLEGILGINVALGASAVQAVLTRKAGALRQFRVTLDGIVGRLRRLDPPMVSRATYSAQLTALRSMSATAGKLATALESGDSSRLPALLRRFDAAAVRPNSLAVQRAQIAAARAYDRQIAQLSDLAVQAEQERTRLARVVQ
jgi:hypothetical protein